MDNKTYNYRELVDLVKTDKDAFMLAQCTYQPSVLMERCDELMTHFSDIYLDTEENRKNLADDLARRPSLVIALYYSIFDQLKDALAMLNECQEYEPCSVKIS